MKRVYALLFAVLGLCSCVSSVTPTPLPPTPDARATETQIAARIFANLTASVPTPTLTPVGTPTQTSIPLVTNAVLARDFKSDTGTPVDVTTEYDPGQGKFHLVLTVKDVPPQTKLKPVWTVVDTGGIIPPNTTLEANEFTIAGSGTFEITIAPKTGQWASGKYKVDLYVNNQLDRTLNFSVRAPIPTSTRAFTPTFTPKPPTDTPRPPPTNTPRPPVPSFGEGIKIVGTDIAPGTYRSRGGSGCYWERLRGFGGSVDDIIANDNVTGPTVVIIKGTDKGFSSRRCGTWTQDLSPITSSQTAPFGDGTFIVNRDIAPGRWRSSGGGGCYWERLKGFGGEVDDIIANDNVTGQAIVDIGARDAGFSSTRCGTWTKIN